MTNKDLFNEHHINLNELKSCLTKEVFTSLSKNKSLFKSKMGEFIKNIVDDRDHYFNNFFKGTITDEVHYPVNIKRLLKNIKFIHNQFLQNILMILILNGINLINIFW